MDQIPIAGRLFWVIILCFCFSGLPNNGLAQSLDKEEKDSIRLVYPFHDDPFLRLHNTYKPISLKPPKNIQREILFDPISKQYRIREKLGTKEYRPPLYMTIPEYKDLIYKSDEKEYWESLSHKKLQQERERRLIPQIEVESPAFEKIFGGNIIDIRPKGSLDLRLIGQHNKNQNPLLSEYQRKQWGIDFDQNINLNLAGSVGERVNVNANFNSRAQFDFENQVRFDYVGEDDAILQRLEIGNVNLPLTSTLIQGSESLFGVKAQLQFGKLDFTGVLSQQRSRQQEFTISRGNRETDFSIELAEYEENQHFFLAQYFRENFNKSLEHAPIINSPVNITQIEVWINNRSNSYEHARDVLALMDIGEYNPHSNTLINQGNSRLPSSGIPGDPNTPTSNDLLSQLGESGRESNGSFIKSFFAPAGGEDNYSKLSNARKLEEGRDYTLNRRLGYISLRHHLTGDQVLSVAYKYIANGREYQVGEFSTDVPVTPSNPKMLYTKLLKGEVINTNLPVWDLMMKNVYSIHATNISEQDFFAQIYRIENESGAERPAIYEGQNTAEKTWLQVFALDRVTHNFGSGADGLFDFIDSVTVDSKLGKIIIPLVEPLGKDLEAQFSDSEQDLIEKYTFSELYSETQSDAVKNHPEKNRYVLKGRYNAGSGSEFQLGALNLRPGSLRVMAGGALLQEGEDYMVDYQLGNLRILNEALVASGQPITVSLEDDGMSSLQQKSFLGGRFDYYANENLQFGATALHMTEKPLSEKVTIGNEPISNTMLGADITYSTPSRWLTRMVDKIPFISTKEESNISFYGEYAHFLPGHPKGLNTDNEQSGTTYIDDFEQSVSYIDLKAQYNWQISSTPRMFPESDLSDDLAYGFNRARMAFYNIDPVFYIQRSRDNPGLSIQQLKDPRVRLIYEQDVFPFKEPVSGQPTPITTLDITYYPKKRGPYNYRTNDINNDGTLQNPKSNWGGMFRGIDQNDFEAQNIEFIEMWMMDPLLTNPHSSGGDIYINLGNISEDILKDGRKSLENAVPVNGDMSLVDETNWGYVSKNQPAIQAFDNNPDNRAKQDVGLDGMGNQEETEFHQNFLNQMEGMLNPEAMTELHNDPSSDDYIYFRGKHFSSDVGILKRYEKFNGLEGNSRTNEQSQADFGVETSSNTLLPDGEDVNRDNTMHENDNYYQYRLSTRPQDFEVGKNFIVDKQTTNSTLVDGSQEEVTWYKIRIPISEYESKYGSIDDFKSIRFIRMFLTDYEDTTVLRLAKFQLVRGEWRKYNSEDIASKVISDPSMGAVSTDNSTYHVSHVNIEENSGREPIPYVVPPGINRQIDWQNNNLDVQLNEQALSLEVNDLKDGYGRAAYKMSSHDFRAYGRLKMFIHAEGEYLRAGDFRAFLRIGTDDRYNYYEYDMPLSITPYGTTSPDRVWPEENRMEIRIKLFQEAKMARENALYNGQPWPHDIPFEYQDGENRIVVLGNPDISKVRFYMVGVRNPLKGSTTSTDLDDGRELSGVFWFNELRLTDFDDQGGWAASAQMDIKLADFANIAFSGTKTSMGFGYINQRFHERSRSEDLLLDITTNAELGKFFHPRHGVVIPFYFNYSKQQSTPEYNPINPDIELNTALQNLSRSQQDSLLRLVQDYTSRKSFSFNNVRKINTDTEKTIKPWHIENFSVSYAFSEYNHRDHNTAVSLQKTYRGALDYNYSSREEFVVEPFKWVRSDYLKIFKDLNFNLLPSLLNFRMDVNRVYNENTLRDNTTDNLLPTYFNKNFNMNRIYGISWDLTKSIRLDFNATNYSIIDEPDGRLNGIKRDTVWSNFWKMGRTSDYNHMMNLTYSLPINKIPYLEWVDIEARYGTQFNWQSEPLLSLQSPDMSLGNSIQNNRTIQINPRLDMNKLYEKFNFIRRNRGRGASGSGAFFTQLLTGIRKIEGAYTRIEGTYLPGYLPKTNLLGYDFDKSAPGWSFLMGSQRDILSSAFEKGWISNDTLQSQMYTKTYAENLSALVNFEPIKDLRIDLIATRVDNHNYSAAFETDPNTDQLTRTAPYVTGNYNISQIAIRTSFKNHKTLFREFEEHRQTISHILAEDNINSVGQDSEMYADGYGKSQQDVVVNSFLSTYLGKNLSSSSLNKKPTIPLPNWRINYNGLGKLPLLREIFNNISIHHGYNSQYVISGYNSVLRYQEVSEMPSARDGDNNFLPKNLYQEVSIIDQFLPLIGADIRFKNNISANSEYRTSRNLNFSLQNSQMAMMTDDAFVFGMGYRKNNTKLPFGWFGDKQWTNDVNFKLDVAVNDRKTVVYRSDLNQTEISGGNKSISFNPTLDFTLNQMYNISFFYNSNVVRPYTSQNFATAYTYFGINLRLIMQ